MENIDLEDALNAGAYHPEGISKRYSTFFNKFAVFVGDGKYIHGDMKTMILKHHFNIIVAKLVHHLDLSSNYMHTSKSQVL